MLGAVVFLLASSLAIVGVVAAPVMRDTRAAGHLIYSKQAYTIAEGALEDSVYRYVRGKSVSNPEVLTLSGTTVFVGATDIGSTKEITASGDLLGRVRNVQASLEQGAGVTFNYGVQTDQGGFAIENSATVVGNVYSNGPITGENSNLIKGTAVSAGPSGLIDGVHATSSAYAHTIRDSDIDGNAYYTLLQSTIVGGTSYPGSPDLATSTLPITDSMIDTWESQALAGGTHTSPCPYNITGSVTLGPRKINCDLNVSGSATITLTGPVWVSGNITFQNSAVVTVHSSVGNSSVAIIADNPNNRTSSSRITLQNSVDVNGNGGDKSYILMLSRNRDAKLGGSNKAIVLQNSANGDLLLYAGEGEIEIQNSAQLNEVTAWKIRLKNSAQVIYKSGLANLLFTSGPSGGYTISSWEETE